MNLTMILADDVDAVVFEEACEEFLVRMFKDEDRALLLMSEMKLNKFLL